MKTLEDSIRAWRIRGGYCGVIMWSTLFLDRMARLRPESKLALDIGHNCGGHQ